MPLPLLIIGAAALAAGLAGIGKGVEAISDSSKAQSKNIEAQNIFDAAKNRMQRQRKSTRKTLENLGLVKLNTWKNQIKTFVVAFKKIKNVELIGAVAKEGNTPIIEETTLKDMKDISFHASEVLSTGITGLSAGTLAGVGAYSGATMFATASTGTAIASLSGVAASNATLAWFGGGSLAAGGGGMALGTLVLGGIVAGPALLIGGFVLSAEAKKKLAEAKCNLAKSREAEASMGRVTTALNGIQSISTEYTDFLEKIIPYVNQSIKNMKNILKKSGNDYKKCTKDERKQIYITLEYVNLLKSILETPLLTKKGNLKPGVSKKLLDYTTSLVGLNQ